MHIKLAGEEHLAAINEIYNQAVKRGATAHLNPIALADRKLWFNEHKDSGYPVFIYLHEGTVAGWACYSPYRKGREALRHTAEITYYVAESFQRRGIGTALIKYLVNTSYDYGFKNLFAIILENNTASMQLMEKCGFERWGFLPGVADFNGSELGHYYYGIRI